MQKRLVIVPYGQKYAAYQEILGEEANRMADEDVYHLVARRKNKLDWKRRQYLKIRNEV